MNAKLIAEVITIAEEYAQDIVRTLKSQNTVMVDDAYARRMASASLANYDNLNHDGELVGGRIQEANTEVALFRFAFLAALDLDIPVQCDGERLTDHYNYMLEQWVNRAAGTRILA